MTQIRFTHIGGPTLLIEIDGWVLLTDPTFDPPGGRYSFGWGTSSRKLLGPALVPTDLPPVDVVLLTHDGHGDNLDRAGRAMLPTVGRVVTTVDGAARLAATLGAKAVGLVPWSALTLAAPGRTTVEITATPARHGPPLMRPIVGEVIGFALHWAGQRHGPLWISGDTVYFPGLREVARRLAVGTTVLHLGGVRFPATGPLRYTLTPDRAVRLLQELNARTVVPVHYEGWTHFRDGRDAIESALAARPELARTVRWLQLGTATTIGV